MKQSKFTRALCFVLSALVFLGSFGITAAASEVDEQHKDISQDIALDEMESYLNAISYEQYLAQHADKQPGSDRISVDLSTVVGQQTSPTKLEDRNAWANVTGAPDDFKGLAVVLPNEGSATFTFAVAPEQAGMYHIAFSYYTLKQSVNSIERKLYIDGEIPFSEASYLTLSKVWKYAYEQKDGENVFREDLLGNSLTPDVAQHNGWRTYYCTDSSGYTTAYYAFFLSAGEHTITLEAEREEFILGAIDLVPTNEDSVLTTSYADYLAYVKNTLGATKGNGEIRLQAEKPNAVSDSAVYMSSDRSSAINEPKSTSAQLYNVIGADSYNSVGQWAAYDFTVTSTGLYNLVMRYKQTTLEGMYICRSIKLWSDDGMYGLPDGTPTSPFSEAGSARFEYDDDWQVSAVGDGETTFEFYFKEGVKYTVYLEVSLGSLADPLNRVSNSLDVINDCYLRILQLTGASPDADRIYNFKDVMPDVLYHLCNEALVLDEVKTYFEDICGTTGEHLSTLELVSDLLARMGTDETEIPGKLSTLKSYLGTLGTWLNDSRSSVLMVDWIQISYVESEDDLPRARAGFFRSLWFEFVSFINSFFTEYDQMGVTSEEDISENALDVWLASGRDQSKIWRSLIDSQFGEYCVAKGSSEIPTALKLITGGTLLPSILSGKGPDVYMGLDSTTTINYAIRGAVIPIVNSNPSLSFEGAENYLAQNFHPAAVNTVELLGDIYGVPMTMNFAMMYYRVDVLVELGVGVPETWEDLLSMLPALQANNLTAGIGTRTATNAADGLNTTFEILLYQAGASMWKYEDPSYYGGIYAGAQIGLDTNEALDVFHYYCRLYTDYNFPYKYDAANRFRTGEMPLMIGDYVSVYNQLVVFATEIDGLWQFSSIPGTRNAEGKLNYDAIATVTNLVIPYSKNRTDETRAQAWEYIQWNASAEAQSTYGNRMVALIGPSAKYAAANRDAIQLLSWTTKEYRAINDQLNHLTSIKNYPGSYIIVRYINFAFLDAYNNGTDAVDSLQGYISAINTELTRKREEFGDSGLEKLEQGQTPEQREEQKKQEK